MTNWIKQTALYLGIILIGNFIAFKLVHVPLQVELVILAAVILFYPIIRNPLFGVYALFIILPFIPHLRRLYYLIHSRPTLDPLIVVGDILLFFILIGLFFEFKENEQKYKGVRKYVLIIAIYFLYLLLRVFAFNFLPLSESIAKFKLYGPPVLSFFVGLVYAHHTEHLKRIWYITVIIGIAAGLYGLKQLHFGYSEAEKIWFNNINFTTLFIQGIARPFSFFQAPVAFADYQQLAIIGALTLSGMRTRFSKFFLLFVPLFFYAVLITSVRSSWIGIMITFVLWFTLFHIRGNKQRVTIMAVSFFGFVLFEFLKGTVDAGLSIGGFFDLIMRVIPKQQYIDLLVTNRTTALENPLGEHSLISRFVLWKFLFTSSIDPIYGLVGRGLGTLKADSLYMTYLAEFGYPGLLFIVLIIFSFVRKGVYLMDTAQDSDIRMIAKGVTSLNVVFAIVSLTGTHIHYFPGDIYFWFWNGVLIMIYSNRNSQPNAKYETADNY